MEPLQPEAFLPLAGSFVNDRMDGGTDPFDTVVKVYQLEEIYTQNNVRLDKREMLLKTALRLHGSFYDPASSRYLFVDPDEVKKKLSQIEASSP